MDKVTPVKNEVQAEEWAAKIRACRGSGMSITAWCRENGIAPKTYYYHLRKLRENAVKFLGNYRGYEHIISVMFLRT